jgi:hypothetical protein
MPAAVSSAYYGGYLYAVVPWGERTLYEIADVEGGGAFPMFVLGSRGKGPPAPEVTKGSGGCRTKLLGHSDLQVSPSGELLGVGKLCVTPESSQLHQQPGPGALAVERWPKGSRKATVEVLPGSEGLGTIMHGRARMDLLPARQIDVVATFAEGGAYVAHYDGNGWTDISPKSNEEAGALWRTPDGSLWLERKSSLQRRRNGAWETLRPDAGAGSLEWSRPGPDGTMWARFGEALYRIAGNGPLHRVTLPRDDKGDRLVPLEVDWLGQDMFVLATSNVGTTLLRDVKPESVLRTDEGAAPTGAAAEAGAATPAGKQTAFGRVTAATPACKELFVVLYKLSKVAPPDFDFPLTRAALKGHTELTDVQFAETEDAGRRYFVAFVPSFATGRKLVTLIQDKVKGSTPQLLCGKPPKTNRQIAIDLKTGEIKK